MSLLEIIKLSHSFGDNILFKDACFNLNKGEHIGIVGKNGTGKSTFIKICTGQLIPDEGRIIWQPDVKRGYLDQYAQIDKTLTIDTFLKTAFVKLYEMEKKMNSLYEEAEKCSNVLKRAAQYQEELERQEFYLIDTKIDQIMEGLGLTVLARNHPVGQMSAGQRAKVILAKLLLEKPDILLLDEPTNFLDKEHIHWLSEYLSKLPNAFLAVSHDKSFLEQICTGVCDIDQKKTVKYNGSYPEFLVKKERIYKEYSRKYSAQERQVKKTEEFIRKNIAGRKSKMARGRRKQLERMEKIAPPAQEERKLFFSFQKAPVKKAEYLKINGLSVGYHIPILAGLNFSVKGGDKIAVTGFNGIGKSTFLKTLMGKIPPIKGEFCFSSQAKIGYYEQDFNWLDLRKTPVQILSDSYPSLKTKEVRELLAKCGISQRQATQEIKTLSGGEQAKVQLCLLMHTSYNFLILDEPTNHLDIPSKEALKKALKEFEGAVLLVSHEESFYQDWIKKVINIEKAGSWQ